MAESGRLLIDIHKDRLGVRKTRAVHAALAQAGFRVERALSKWDVMYLERA